MDDQRKPAVGARPGTLIVDRNLPKPRIRLSIYVESGVEEFEIDDLSRLAAVPDSPQKHWIDVQGLGDEEVLRRLGEIFGIHPLALEDVVNIPIRPKTETYEQNQFFVGRAFAPAEGSDAEAPELQQVCLVLGTNWVISFLPRPSRLFDPVCERLRAAKGPIRRLGVDYLAYVLLDLTVDSYFEPLERFSEELEQLEEVVLEDPGPETLQRLNRIRGTLGELRRTLVPQRDAVNRLLRDHSPFIDDGVLVYLRDTWDHCVQAADTIESNRELVNGLSNTYLSVVSNKMNEVMKVLTIMASLFVPLTFLAGIYGMNFENMPELKTPWGYYTLLAVMAATGMGLLVWFYRKGWIQIGRARS